jgi:N-acetylglucosamine kinase-like BadF-type ATPase
MIALGFDSGGSKTSYAVDRCDGAGPQVGTEATVSISDARGGSSTRTAIEWIVSEIATLEDEEVVVWIGAAGFSAATAPALQKQFEEPLAKLSESFEARGQQCEIFIANDVVSVLKTSPAPGVGVAAIVGTGSVVIGAHPAYSAGVVQRGGFEWIVSDEGAGVWMTLECTRRLLADIQSRGSQDYHSALLERLADFAGISSDDISHVPKAFQSMAKADLIARKLSEARPDIKRFLSRFVYPNIFELAVLESGRSYDPIAAEVLSESVRVMVEKIKTVSDILAAHTADEPNLRQSLPLILGGNIACHPYYEQLLRAEVSRTCRFIESVAFIGDAADELASLSARYARADPRERGQITRSFDALHPVLRLL